LSKIFIISKLGDEDLLKHFRENNENKFLEELYGRYIRFVFLVCMKYLKNEEKAKDMSMQVFEKLTGDIKRFDIQNFKSWLHVVTKNSCLMQLRSEKNHETVALADKKDLEKNMENGSFVHHECDDEVEVKLEQLQTAIEKLEFDQKKCIELFYLQEKSYKEVCDETGFSMNQVKSYIQNGKRNLKIILSGSSELFVFMLLARYFG
jgi:RNA polymerase sigma-70 factor (ECF subfamily)